MWKHSEMVKNTIVLSNQRSKTPNILTDLRECQRKAANVWKIAAKMNRWSKGCFLFDRFTVWTSWKHTSTFPSKVDKCAEEDRVLRSKAPERRLDGLSGEICFVRCVYLCWMTCAGSCVIVEQKDLLDFKIKSEKFTHHWIPLMWLSARELIKSALFWIKAHRPSPRQTMSDTQHESGCSLTVWPHYKQHSPTLLINTELWLEKGTRWQQYPH